MEVATVHACRLSGRPGERLPLLQALAEPDDVVGCGDILLERIGMDGLAALGEVEVAGRLFDGLGREEVTPEEPEEEGGIRRGGPAGCRSTSGCRQRPGR